MRKVRVRVIGLTVSSLLLSILAPVLVQQATAAPALVTCVNIESGAERISRTGKCRIGREAQANWHKNQTDSAIASGVNAKVITICSNKESSPVSYKVIRKKCARHQVTTIFSRSGSLPTKPIIAEVVSFGHDNASLKLAADPASTPDAPIAYYTITIRNVDTSTATKIETKRIYSWRDLGLMVSGLQGRTTYTFTVTATSVDGTSAVSIASIPVTTPAYVPPVSTSSSSSSVATPAFTLSSTAETKTVNNAISGYTITSTGGTIASYVISPAAPAGTTFSSSTGLLSGTPTSTQGATSYTITGTNAAGSSTGTFTLTITALAAGPASMLAVSRASVGTSAGVAFSTQPQVTVQDASGNTVTSSSAVVTATISARGSLLGTTSATASGGVATFNNLGVRGFGGTAYTITYATTGLTSATETVTPSTYALGATGPGGGKIYYMAPDADGFACGAPRTSTCFYLEVAPSNWIENDVMPWAIVTSNVADIPDGGGYSDASFASIGIGLQYSEYIVAQNVNPYDPATPFAAGAARAYQPTVSGVTYSDWYLPSTAELNTLCQWSRGVPHSFTECKPTGTPPSFGSDNSSLFGAQSSALSGTYWASSENGASGNGKISLINSQGGVAGNTKSNTSRVRPIRAF
jgi:hypothetical protein